MLAALFVVLRVRGDSGVEGRLRRLADNGRAAASGTWRSSRSGPVRGNACFCFRTPNTERLPEVGVSRRAASDLVAGARGPPVRERELASERLRLGRATRFIGRLGLRLDDDKPVERLARGDYRSIAKIVAALEYPGVS